MDDHCPKCGNEIYKPYKYCNACGWEKSEEEETDDAEELDEFDEFDEWGEDEEDEEDEFIDDEEDERFGKKASKHSKKRSKRKGLRKGKTKKKGKQFPEKVRRDTTESDKLTPLKITCKCGGVIKIKSSKRPLKFKCPDCGKKGTLKGSEKVKPDSIKKEAPKSKGLKDNKGRKKRGYPYSDFDEEEFAPKKTSKPSQKRRRPSEDEPQRVKRSKQKCPNCGTRLSGTGSCSSCGYRLEQKTRFKSDDFESMGARGKHSKKKRPKFKPPESAHVVKPVKGKCTWCGSRNLRYFDDGSGRCTNCGREFNFGGDSSRIQKKEYLCHRCRKPLEFIEEYNQWYCYNCAEYA